MTESKKFELFEEAMNDLSTDELITIYNNTERFEDIFYFEEDFFENMFATKMDAAMATSLGTVDWSDEYIQFDGYGNLESLSDYDARQKVLDNLSEIYDHEDAWSDYIDIDDFEDEEDEDS